MKQKTKVSNKHIIFILALLMMAFFVFGQGQYSIYGACEPKEQAGFALVPYYGYYSCEPVLHVEVHNTLQLPARDNADDASMMITCGDDEFIKDSCGSVAVYCQSGNQIVLQADGTDFPIGGSEWAITPVTPNTFTTIINKMNKGERVKFRGCIDKGWLTFKYVSGTVKSYHLPYGLYNYERGSKDLISSSDCNVPSNIDQCKDCVVSNLGIGIDSGVSSITNNPRADLLPDTYSTYIKDWLMTPIKSGTNIDKDGTRVFCTNKIVYSSDTVRTEAGCALIPMKVKRQVDCCPGEKLNQYTYCSNDFEWVYGDMGCIVGGVQTIAACNGGGKWYTSTSRTYQKATVCNSDGTCTYTTLTAACAPPNIGCPANSLCQVDINNPNNNKCVGGLVPCGDADNDCRDDCTGTVIAGCENEVTDEPCAFDSQCDDDNIFTIDRCEGTKIAGIDTGINKRCTNTDMTIWYSIAMVVVVMFMIVIFMIIMSGSRVKTKVK